MALKRLFANERVFARKKEYAKKYDDVIQDYANSDYAELLRSEAAKVQRQRRGIYPISESTTAKRSESSSTERQSATELR